MADYYAVLGVRQGATADEIRKAYRALARKYHPDVNKEPGALERFKESQEAYDVLSDDEKRARYDRVGHDAYVKGYPAGVPGGGGGGVDFGFDGSDIGSIFETFFGGRDPSRQRARRAQRGRDLATEVTIEFGTMVTGGKRTVTVTRGGQRRDIDVTIPKAVADGGKLRVRGEGHPGVGGGSPGDLILTVRVAPHPTFKRGAPESPSATSLDVTTTVPLRIHEAVFGGPIEVQSPSGRSATLKSPPGAASGSKLRLKNLGLESAAGKTGDLYAVLRVIAPSPDELTPEQAEAIREAGEAQPDPRAQHDPARTGDA
ncbi:MAG: DnaJ C-terminal domain-containing protein [Planctomycetota bacterium]